MAQLGGIPPSVFRNLPLVVQNELGELSVQDQAAFLQEFRRNAKSTGLAYFFWFFLGFQYLYLGKWGIQFIYWFTLGGLGIWALVDLFRIPGMVRDFNQDVAADAMMTVKTILGSRGQNVNPAGAILAAPVQNLDVAPVPDGSTVPETPNAQQKTIPASHALIPLSATFEVLTGSQQGTKIHLQGMITPQGVEVTVGREAGDLNSQAHVLLSDPTVSRQQAQLLFQNDQYSLINISDTNPTRVNGVPLDPNEKVYLSPGDRIRFGDIETLFQY